MAKKKGYPRNPAGINQYIKGTAHKEKGAAIAVRLPLELDEKFRKLAAVEGNSLSKLLQIAIEQLLEKSQLDIAETNRDGGENEIDSPTAKACSD